MTDLAAVARATQASARAIASMNKWQFVMRDNRPGTPAYQQASFNFSKAQQRYRNAQKTLAMNPLPGDDQ